MLLVWECKGKLSLLSADLNANFVKLLVIQNKWLEKDEEAYWKLEKKLGRKPFQWFSKVHINWKEELFATKSKSLGLNQNYGISFSDNVNLFIHTNFRQKKSLWYGGLRYSIPIWIIFNDDVYLQMQMYLIWTNRLREDCRIYVVA